MNVAKKDLLLYAITDRRFEKTRTIYEQVEEALQGQITMLQLREKEISDEQFLEEANVMKKICDRYSVPLIINDNVKVAMACHAAGVHVGQSDRPVKMVREELGDEKIIGVSAQTVAEAVEAEKNGADYLGVGAVFATKSKADADHVSLDTLKEITAAVSIPVVAIGGITAENMVELKDTKIAGAAIITAIFGATDIKKECRKLGRMAKTFWEEEQ